MFRKVLDSCLKSLRIVSEAADAVVATVAKRRAYFASLVVVVYVQVALQAGTFVDGKVVCSANRAASVLGSNHGLVLVESDAIQPSPIALFDSGFAYSLSPANRRFGFARVAMTPTVSDAFVCIPRELFDRLYSLASRAWFLCDVSASSAHPTRSSLMPREFALRPTLSATYAVHEFFGVEKSWRGKMSLHVNSLWFACRGTAVSAARAHFVG